VTGKGLQSAQVERAINLSKEKYCSATIMLAQSAQIDFDYEIREA
jgi:putative redox protein